MGGLDDGSDDLLVLLRRQLDLWWARALSTRHGVERGREGVVEKGKRRGEEMRDTSMQMSIN